MILAWVIVESENEDSWRYFFRHLVLAIPEVAKEETMFISDQDKGLVAADEELGKKMICADFDKILL